MLSLAACAQIVAAAAEEGGAAEPSVKGECPQSSGPLPAPLITEVHGALARLTGALGPGQGGHLLELVARLQAGLLSAGRTPGGPPPPRTFKRRDRKARHTVGVTREELIDARKMVEDMNFPLQLEKPKQQPIEKPVEAPPPVLPYALQKQASLGTLLQQERSSPIAPQSPVRNSTAQPFALFNKRDEEPKESNGFMSPKIIANNPQEDQMVFHSAATVQQRQAPNKQMAQVDVSPIVNSSSKPKPILQGSMSLDRGSESYLDDVAKIVQESLIKAAQKKTTEVSMESIEVKKEEPEVKKETPEVKKETIEVKKEILEVKKETPEPSIPSDEEPEPIKASVVLRQKKPAQMETIPPSKMNGHLSSNRFSGNFNYSAPQAPIYQEYNKSTKPMSRVKEIEQKLVNGSNTTEQIDFSKSNNRFSNKKFRMKRANTIDIPKPLHCYQVDSDDEGGELARMKLSTTDLDKEKPTVPQFKPKTDNDLKFLAFIQKHNNNDTNSLWSHNTPSAQRGAGCNWSSCFGSIKNVFEGSTAENSRSSSAQSSSAKKFWKTSDDSINFQKPSNFGPKLTKSSANYLNSLHDSKKQFKCPQIADDQEEVITGSLMVAGPNMINGGLGDRKLIKPIPKPIPVNQFYHAPMSAFKPLPKKVTTTVMSPTSAYPPPNVWSPPSVSGKVKKLASNDFNKPIPTNNNNIIKNGVENHTMPITMPFLATKPPTQRSPLGPSAPWAWTNNSKDNRILNLAVNKFEKAPQDETIPQPLHIPPYKEKNFNPVTTQNGLPPAKRLSLPQALQVLPSQGPLSAPNLVQKLENLKQHFDKKAEEEFPKKIDAERLQIEFYEKQIRQNSKYSKPSAIVPATRRFSEHLPSQNDYSTYTVTDFTPPSPVSTFVPLPQIPDIEESKPRPLKKLPDLVLNNLSQDSSKQSPVVSPSKIIVNNVTEPMKQTSPKIIEQKPAGKDDSDANQTEYKAVTTKVMRGPVSGQAIIKPKSTQETYEKRDTAAKSLKGVLQKFSSPKHDVISQIEKKKKTSPDNVYSPPKSNVIENNVTKDFNSKTPKPKSHTALVKPSQMIPNPNTITHSSQIPNSYNHTNHQASHNNNSYVIPTIKYNNTSSNKYNASLRSPEANRTQNHIYSQRKNGQAYSSDSLEINANGESVVSSKLHFPQLNNMAFISPSNSSGSQTPSPTALSKSESWHQLNATKPPSPRLSSPANKVVSRAKSMHLLGVPKQFEAGITKEKINEKKKTVEAYFSGNISPNQLSKSSSQHSLYESCDEQNKHSNHTPSPKYQPKAKVSAISRHATSEKISTQSSNFGLGRSSTMPQMTYADLALLDEGNVEDAFDDLFKSS